MCTPRGPVRSIKQCDIPDVSAVKPRNDVGLVTHDLLRYDMTLVPNPPGRLVSAPDALKSAVLWHGTPTSRVLGLRCSTVEGPRTTNDCKLILCAARWPLLLAVDTGEHVLVIIRIVRCQYIPTRNELATSATSSQKNTHLAETNTNNGTT